MPSFPDRPSSQPTPSTSFCRVLVSAVITTMGCQPSGSIQNPGNTGTEDSVAHLYSKKDDAQKEPPFSPEEKTGEIVSLGSIRGNYEDAAERQKNAVLTRLFVNNDLERVFSLIEKSDEDTAIEAMTLLPSMVPQGHTQRQEAVNKLIKIADRNDGSKVACHAMVILQLMGKGRMSSSERDNCFPERIIKF